MDRQLHKPDLNIEQRMIMAEDIRSKLFDLLEKGWTDVCIAGYVGLDQYTIKRFRKKYGIVGKRRERCPEYSYIQ